MPSRRIQATRAEALLTLSSALAEIVSTEDMAERIAQAVPSVIDCDRAIVMFNGRVVGELPAADADEPTLVRAAHGISARAAAAAAEAAGGATA